jgi:hypothetical protein
LIPVRVVCSSDRRPRLSRVAPRRRAPTAAPPRAGPSPHVHDESSTTPCARPRASRIPRRCALAASGPGCSTRRAAGEPMHDLHNEPTILDVAATQLRGTSNRAYTASCGAPPPTAHTLVPTSSTVEEGADNQREQATNAAAGSRGDSCIPAVDTPYYSAEAPKSSSDRLAAPIPAARPVAHAQKKLYPPTGPNASSTSPQMNNPG